MFEHLCPKCGKKSYSSDEEYFSPCPYCGFKFSRKYGSDRRCEERVKKESVIALICQGKRFEATSTDFSKKGLGIKISGEFPGAAGDTVDLFINDLQSRAKVMWVDVDKVYDVCKVGLQTLS